MTKPTKSASKPYTATTVVSPMLIGEEPKNQDRARWYEPDQTACVADGVTNSPHAAEAASLAVSLSQCLFKGVTRERIAMMCDVLDSRRQQSQGEDAVIPENIPESMRPMLQKVINEKKKHAYQTTFIAAQFSSDDHNINTRIVKCGDSAFMAFSHETGLLFSSVGSQSVNYEADTLHRSGLGSGYFRFGPGDKLLVRVEGYLSNMRSIAMRVDLKDEQKCNWLVCKPIEATNCQGSSTAHALESKTLLLNTADRLLVPKYLWGQIVENDKDQYRLLHYSSTIKPFYSAGSNVFHGPFNHGSCATTVLPDHFHSGEFDYYRDSFPTGTQFILSSDGFYSSFASAHQLWAWLQDHKSSLIDCEKRAPLINQLHQQLNDAAGDDDISFVWVYPKKFATSNTID